MLLKKICMLGAYAVGKTSLVSRFVYRLYDERYHSTVGVRIDKAKVEAGGQSLELMLWDLEGDDELAPLRQSYLRGAAGYILVGDGTRPATFDAIETIQRNAREVLGDVPFVVAVNKCDLSSAWALEDAWLGRARARGWTCVETSAKTGVGVPELFVALAERLAGPIRDV
ncbi:MAG: Rab family GTPase [Vicinamibacterales bacterium]